MSVRRVAAMRAAACRPACTHRVVDLRGVAWAVEDGEPGGRLRVYEGSQVEAVRVAAAVNAAVACLGRVEAAGPVAAAYADECAAALSAARIPVAWMIGADLACLACVELGVVTPEAETDVPVFGGGMAGQEARVARCSYCGEVEPALLWRPA